jgi:hypothetical protein
VANGCFYKKEKRKLLKVKKQDCLYITRKSKAINLWILSFFIFLFGSENLKIIKFQAKLEHRIDFLYNLVAFHVVFLGTISKASWFVYTSIFICLPRKCQTIKN